MVSRYAKWILFGFTLVLAATAGAASNIVRCVDGRLGGVTQTGRPSLELDLVVCDADGQRDGTCRFASYCPLCLLESPPCLAPCATLPRYSWATVPQGRAVSVRTGSGIFLCRCDRVARRRPAPPR